MLHREDEFDDVVKIAKPDVQDYPFNTASIRIHTGTRKYFLVYMAA